MTIYDLLDRIEARPAMFLLRPGFASLAAFVQGYEMALMFRGLEDAAEPPFSGFGGFVVRALESTERTWQHAITAHEPDDLLAMNLFFRLLNDYRGELPPASSAALAGA